jgi:hypothetical protein
MFGAPGAITRGDLNDDFTFDFGTVSSGAVAHVWDAGAQQWSPLQSDTDGIAAGQGVALYFFDDTDDPIGPSGIDLQMPGTRSAQSDVTRTRLGTGQFVFVANPYLEGFDLSSLDITSSDFSQTVQVFDPDQGSFLIRDRSSSETVAALQGFFVERLSPGRGPTSLTFSKSGVQNDPGSFIGTKSEAPALASAGAELRLVVKSEGDTLAQNRATVLFHEGAAPGWDAYDATQLAPLGSTSCGPSVSAPAPSPSGPACPPARVASACRALPRSREASPPRAGRGPETS